MSVSVWLRMHEVEGRCEETKVLLDVIWDDTQEDEQIGSGTLKRERQAKDDTATACRDACSIWKIKCAQSFSIFGKCQLKIQADFILSTPFQFIQIYAQIARYRHGVKMYEFAQKLSGKWKRNVLKSLPITIGLIIPRFQIFMKTSFENFISLKNSRKRSFKSHRHLSSSF